PVVGMVGKLPDPDTVPGQAFREEGHAIGILGAWHPALAGSELEKLRGSLADHLPAPDLAEHAAALEHVRGTVRSGALASAHDISDGGLACALAESAIAGGIGARVEVESEVEAFGESPGGVVVSGPADVLERAGARLIGEVGGDSLEIAYAGATLDLLVVEVRSVFSSAIPDHFS
nr:phosphoribosylformylglycinamidine synthase subunit PurL [Thermoleophilaceae bacterium]